jgi:hypothetical protein
MLHEFASSFCSILCFKNQVEIAEVCKISDNQIPPRGNLVNASLADVGRLGARRRVFSGDVFFSSVSKVRLAQGKKQIPFGDDNKKGGCKDGVQRLQRRSIAMVALL